ncbi:MAG: HPr family phosphocarrier protein [Oscillospiraceae bacterium]
MTRQIQFKSAADIKSFNSIATSSNGSILLHTGEFSVDARSLLGLLSLDYTKPINCEADNDDFFCKISAFLI